MDRGPNSDTMNNSSEIKVTGSVFAYAECENFFPLSIKENEKQSKKNVIYTLRTKTKTNLRCCGCSSGRWNCLCEKKHKIKCKSSELLSWSDIYRLSTLITACFFVTALYLSDLRLVHNAVCKVFPRMVKKKCNLFTHGAPRSSKNSFKSGRAFRD